MVQFFVGTASWTDPSLVNSTLFYPPAARSAEDRLRFYAEHFNTVEVDSTYYVLPSERNAKLWAERTPVGFMFNIKPFALMTQHSAEVARLPKELREKLPLSQRTQRRVSRPPGEFVDSVFQMFRSAIAPLDAAHKLGMITFQFPPYFVARSSNFDYLASLGARLPGTSIAIEFRHPSWVADPKQRAATMDFLRAHGLYYTSIDAPVDKAIVPSFLEATGDQVYMRFHGKNRDNWFKRGLSPSERYKYLYSERELRSHADELERLDQRGVKRVYVIFNNCYQNFGIMNATTMAAILRES